MNDINCKIKRIKELGKPIVGALASGANSFKNFTSFTYSEQAVLLSQEAFMKWLEGLTEEAATIYDKALDAKFLSSNIGGANHRLFDGGHDLLGAWKAASEAKEDDTFAQEVVGYASSLWKDFTTIKGLPIQTLDKASFNEMADFLGGLGISKKYFYDLCSIDAGEFFGTSLMVIGALFHLESEDKQRLSELLGAMGILSIISANPIMGVLAIAVTAYSYFIKKNELDKMAVIKGTTLVGISSTVMTMLGLPIVLELIIVIIVTRQLKVRVFENKDVIAIIERNISAVDPKIRELLNSVIERISEKGSKEVGEV